MTSEAPKKMTLKHVPHYMRPPTYVKHTDIVINEKGICMKRSGELLVSHRGLEDKIMEMREELDYLSLLCSTRKGGRRKTEEEKTQPLDAQNASIAAKAEGGDDGGGGGDDKPKETGSTEKPTEKKQAPDKIDLTNIELENDADEDGALPFTPTTSPIVNSDTIKSELDGAFAEAGASSESPK